ncbi:MAG: formamidopyrimidine-DNA glycosylase [Armatimonadetes bacterium]|nr:formamidopyrimidine-DNA glycosylase [Armatimonadota bacterium]
MPELPDVELYVAKLRERVLGEPLDRLQLLTPFVLRTVEPKVAVLHGRPLREIERLGKRIVLDFGDDLFLVVHLMVAGRFQWKAAGAKPLGRITLALFEFPHGTLLMTEASKKRRASLHVVQGRNALEEMNPGGIEPLECTPQEFAEALKRENRTLKRALTNPRTFSGIGNAYSDEILWAAHLSPLRLTSSLDEKETARLYGATVESLTMWSKKLLEQFATKFPGAGDVTAFRPDFAVHGKFGQPCPRCGHKVQRIVYAENETNYCAECQNEGRLLADRALSRLLKEDWPRTLEEMEG